MSNPAFKDFFLDFQEMEFEISARGGIDFKKVSQKLSNSKAEPFIIDISINGFSNRDDFDFSLNNVHWKDVKSNFVKGQEAQKDPTALTVKRSIRLLAQATSKYIQVHNIEPNLKKYNEKLPATFCHLGGHFVVDQTNARQLLLLWELFDKNKNTRIAESVKRVLDLRFGGHY
jgi:hypothetical protein